MALNIAPGAGAVSASSGLKNFQLGVWKDMLDEAINRPRSPEFTAATFHLFLVRAALVNLDRAGLLPAVAEFVGRYPGNARRCATKARPAS